MLAMNLKVKKENGMYEMKNLGDMVEYAVGDLKYSPDEIFHYFISSGITEKFSSGNPKYVVGMSGYELAKEVLDTLSIENHSAEIIYAEKRSKEYWAGWIMAYYQWIMGKRFEDIVNGGLTLSEVMSMYILHEADNSKFVEEANKRIAAYIKNEKSERIEDTRSKNWRLCQEFLLE